MKYLPELDGLRGIAILLVMGVHANISYMHGGFIGVDIFFVLSGYLISSLLISECNSNGCINFKRFYWRRCIRLMPILSVMLITFMLLGTIVSKNVWDVYRDVLIVFFYCASWTRAFLNLPGDWLGHTWSLSVEEQFYFLWPFILYKLKCLSDLKNIMLLIGVSVVVLLYRYILFKHGSSTDRIYLAFDTRLDALLIGCVLAYLVNCKYIPVQNVVLKKVLRVLTLLSVMYLFYVVVFYDNGSPYFFVYGLSLVVMSSALIILDVICNPNGILARILNNRFLVYTGKISYGLYIWHWPIFHFIHKYSHMAMVYELICCISLSYIISGLSYKYIEKPLFKFKNIFDSNNNTVQNIDLNKSSIVVVASFKDS